MNFMTLKFGLIGDGYIAQRHRQAIKAVGGKIINLYDPKYAEPDAKLGSSIAYYTSLSKYSEWLNFCRDLDFVCICSPTNLHREQIIKVLNSAPAKTQIIVEKPLCLPWEPMIYDDKINVCLQLNWLPKKEYSWPHKIFVRMVRGEAYFRTWKGDPKLTGGIFYNLLIHYIFLAQKLRIPFDGIVSTHGVQIRELHYKDRNGKHFIEDLNLVNMNLLYERMYRDILIGNGIKPKDLFYTHWMLERNSQLFGYGKNCLDKEIRIDYELY